ncbi:hypothetical protein LJK88_50175 [Paenibacillus sp. P26]|nr:hypothetical protein LJK88_50175 [Paenibacillus sp. P26]
MKSSKKKLASFVLSSALMLTAVAGTALADPADGSTTVSDTSTVQTYVGGVWVPGSYQVTGDSRAAFIPGGVGLVVIDKNIPRRPGLIMSERIAGKRSALGVQQNG